MASSPPHGLSKGAEAQPEDGPPEPEPACRGCREPMLQDIGFCWRCRNFKANVGVESILSVMEIEDCLREVDSLAREKMLQTNSALLLEMAELREALAGMRADLAEARRAQAKAEERVRTLESDWGLQEARFAVEGVGSALLGKSFRGLAEVAPELTEVPPEVQCEVAAAEAASRLAVHLLLIQRQAASALTPSIEEEQDAVHTFVSGLPSSTKTSAMRSQGTSVYSLTSRRDTVHELSVNVIALQKQLDLSQKAEEEWKALAESSWVNRLADFVCAQNRCPAAGLV